MHVQWKKSVFFKLSHDERKKMRNNFVQKLWKPDMMRIAKELKIDKTTACAGTKMLRGTFFASWKVQSTRWSGTVDRKLYQNVIKACKADPRLSVVNVVNKLGAATYHCSKNAPQWFRDNRGDVIGEMLSPPNCPEFRSIEMHWGIIKVKAKKSEKMDENDTSMAGNRYK